MDIKEQIAIMQHYANGGKIEYRAKPYGTKSYPQDWKEVICKAAGGTFQFDWEQEEARIKPEPRILHCVFDYNGRVFGRNFTEEQAKDYVKEYPYNSYVKFVEVIE